jgi:hypothetical protein
MVLHVNNLVLQDTYVTMCSLKGSISSQVIIYCLFFIFDLGMALSSLVITS